MVPNLGPSENEAWRTGEDVMSTSKCDTCFHRNSVQSKVSTAVCAKCCAFSNWEPVKTETKEELCFHPSYNAAKDGKAAFESSPDANVEAIRESLLQRSKIGLQKYGVTTERGDLTLEQ